MNGHYLNESKRVEVKMDFQDMGTFCRIFEQNLREIKYSVDRLGKDKIAEPPLEKFFTYPLSGNYSSDEAVVLRERLNREFELFQTMINEFFAKVENVTREDYASRGLSSSSMLENAVKSILTQKIRMLDLLNNKREHALFEINRLSSPLLKITVDTNVVIRYIEDSETDENIRALVTAFFGRKIDLAVTTAIHEDISGASDANKAKLIEILKLIPEISGKPVDANTNVQSKVETILFPQGISTGRSKNKVLDARHIALHIIERRGLFVTNDSYILKKAKELELAFDKFKLVSSERAASIIAGRI